MSAASNAVQFMLGFMIFFWLIALAVVVLVIIATWKVYEKAGEPGWAALVPFYRDYVLFKVSWGNGWFFLLNSVPAVITQIVCFSYYMRIIMSAFEGYGKSFLNPYNFASNAFGMMFVLSLLGTFTFVISIITYIKLAKAFGQGGGFACGLIFLYAIFLCILAFSKNIHYVGIPGKMPPNGQGGASNDPYNRQSSWQNPYYQQNTNNQNPSWGWQPQDAQSDRYGQPNFNSDGAASQATPPGPVKYCPDCGLALKKEDQFCPRCGKPQ